MGERLNVLATAAAAIVAPAIVIDLLTIFLNTSDYIATGDKIDFGAIAWTIAFGWIGVAMFGFVGAFLFLLVAFRIAVLLRPSLLGYVVAGALAGLAHASTALGLNIWLSAHPSIEPSAVFGVSAAFLGFFVAAIRAPGWSIIASAMLAGVASGIVYFYANQRILKMRLPWRTAS